MILILFPSSGGKKTRIMELSDAINKAMYGKYPVTPKRKKTKKKNKENEK